MKESTFQVQVDNTRSKRSLSALVHMQTSNSEVNTSSHEPGILST